MYSGPSFFIQRSLSHLKQLSHPEMAEDLRRRVESTRRGFEVRRLHKHFSARFWWRGKNRTTAYILQPCFFEIPRCREY